MGRPKGAKNKTTVKEAAGAQTTEAWETFGKLVTKVIRAGIRHNPDSASAEHPVVWIAISAGIARSAGKKKLVLSPGKAKERASPVRRPNSSPGSAKTPVKDKQALAGPKEEVFTMACGKMLGGPLGKTCPVTAAHVAEMWASSVPRSFPKRGVKLSPLLGQEDANVLFFDKKNVKGFLTPKRILKRKADALSGKGAVGEASVQRGLVYSSSEDDD